MTLRAWLLSLLAALGGGFIAGRWSLPRRKPVLLAVGATQALPEHDLSPAGQVRTIIVTRTVPGAPAPPPVAAPPELGQHLQTMDTGLGPLPMGGILHDALYGRMEGQRLVLRNIQWIDTPGGPAPIGDTKTTTAAATFDLPAPPEPPRWSAVVLAGLQNGRPVYGGAVGYWRGPVGLQAGGVGNVLFVGGGVRW